MWAVGTIMAIDSVRSLVRGLATIILIQLFGGGHACAGVTGSLDQFLLTFLTLLPKTYIVGLVDSRPALLFQRE